MITMGADWETELAELLTELSAAQDELLDLLQAKQGLLVNADAAGLAAIGDREAQLVARLEACHDHRARMLDQAATDGGPAENLRTLAARLPESSRESVHRRVEQSQARARLLRHQSLANWVLVQRTLIHLSQMLEIIATGGRGEPTYRKGEQSPAHGALVDQAV
jgi:flagellar biosynthesis/type III secretory pathway chaperone